MNRFIHWCDHYSYIPTIFYEWVSDCCLTPTQQCVSCIMVNMLIFHEMMMRFTLYLSDTLSWIFIVIAHWNNSLRIDMSHISDILSWFRANHNQSLLFLLNAACLVARYQFHSLWFDLIGTRTRDLPHSRRACYHYIIDAVQGTLKK
jgi:hypothetical protein